MRKMKRVLTGLVVLVFVVSFSLISFSCQSSAATTAAAAAGTTAAAETTAAAGTTAAAETTAAVVAGTGKRFEGINVWFDTGGPAGNSWSVILVNGINDAQNDLGCKVTQTYGDWTPQKMIDNFKTAVAASPDGIVIFGAPGDDAWMPLVDDAESKGIIVTGLNSNLPGLEAKYGANGFGYVGAMLYDQGKTLATATVTRAGLKKGDRVMVWGLVSQPARGERSKGCVDGFKTAGMTVDYLEISNEISADPSLGTPVISAYISSHPDVKAIIIDHGTLTATIETFLKAAGKGPDDIYAAGFDLSPAIVAQIKDGFVDLVSDQQPYLQGYLPVLQICMTKVLGLSGLHIDTGAGLVDKSNVEAVGPLAEKALR
jgi:simple sugar transport system substrate-binding protein